MNKQHKVPGSFASYKQGYSKPRCDLVEMAHILADNIGNIPKSIGWNRACEINLFAKKFLELNEQFNKDRKDF